MPTVVHHFVRHLRERPDKPCLWFHREGEVVEATWRQIGRDVARMAVELKRAGIDRGDRVALAAPNRYEWITTDLAILAIGAVNVPIHNSLTGPQMWFQIVDSDARVVILAGDDQAAKLAGSVPPERKSMPHFMSYDRTEIAIGGQKPAALDDLPQAGVDERNLLLGPGEHGALVVDLQPGDLATILYTSGTTGEPKGVMLSHGNITTNAESNTVGFGGPRDERRLNLLPFSHIFARTCDLYCWIVGGSEMALCDAPQTAVENAAEFAPHIINAVPYFYERVMRKMVELGVADMPDVLSYGLGGQIRHLCSGGAPLPPHVAEFFNSRGVLLTQGYGLTETAPVITMNTPTTYKHGTVGRPFGRIEVKIADDGEVLTRGPHVMIGYWRRPDETTAALEGGWFHTGDLGEIDADGYLMITGRKKELIVTSGGKKAVPSPIEALITADPLVRQAVVVGDGRKYLAALIVPDREALSAALATKGISVSSDDVCRHPQAEKTLLEAIGKRTAGLSQYEQIRRCAVLEREFSIEKNELTLTMKLRRQEIAKNFAFEIERMYAAERES